MFEFETQTMIHQVYVEKMFDARYKQYEEIAQGAAVGQGKCRVQIMGQCIIK